MDVSERDRWLNNRATEVAQLEGCQLLELRVRQSGSRPSLQVTVDRRDGGVTVDDCARVSRRLSLVLEEADPFRSAYTLEVSSPGLTRRLAQPQEYDHFSGRRVLLELREPLDGQRRLSGTLRGLAEDGSAARLQVDGAQNESTIPLASIAWTRLDFEPESPSASKKGRER